MGSALDRVFAGRPFVQAGPSSVALDIALNGQPFYVAPAMVAGTVEGANATATAIAAVAMGTSRIEQLTATATQSAMAVMTAARQEVCAASAEGVATGVMIAACLEAAAASDAYVQSVVSASVGVLSCRFELRPLFDARLGVLPLMHAEMRVRPVLAATPLTR
jgi:hypothetical protein